MVKMYTITNSYFKSIETTADLLIVANKIVRILNAIVDVFG